MLEKGVRSGEGLDVEGSVEPLESAITVKLVEGGVELGNCV